MAIGKINKVKVDLCSYPPYLFLAEPKFGKTGFWNDLVIKAWGSADKGLLLAFEKGYLSYDGLQVEDVVDWNSDYDEETGLRGFIQIVDDIVENNSEYGLKGVCIDTLDTMIDVATKEVLRLHRKECGTTCKSLLDAFKGYGRGKQRLLDICNEQIQRLRDAGLAVFILCHTKKKTQKDLLSGEEFEQITNNLNSDFYNNFANNAQMIMVGVKNRDIVEGRLVGEKRTVYLRGTTFVDAGSRFENLPDTIDGSREHLVDDFLSAFEHAVKDSIKIGSNDDKAIAKAKKAEEEERAKLAEATKKKAATEDVEEHRAEYLTNIQNAWSSITDETKLKAKEILTAAGFTKYTDADGVTLKSIWESIQ